MVEVTTKKCTKCGVSKEYNLFHKSTKSIDGKQPWCKSCTSKVNREHYKNNKKQKSDYYLRNKESITDRKRIYQRKKPEIHRKANRKYYVTNREKMLTANRLYRKNNPEVGRRKSRKRRAMKRNLPHQPLTPQQYEILHRQKYEIFGGNASGN